MRSALLLATLLTLLACSRKADSNTKVAASASAPIQPAPSAAPAESATHAAPQVISSRDEVCNLLTREEVSVEVKRAVTARTPPRNSPYGAPECTYLTGDGPDAEGYALALFFHPESPDGPASFRRKISDVCVHTPQQPVKDLGDEAVLCRKLLVRKGNVFFVLFRQGGDPAAPWGDAAQRLARKAVSRLP